MIPVLNMCKNYYLSFGPEAKKVQRNGIEISERIVANSTISRKTATKNRSTYQYIILSTWNHYKVQINDKIKRSDKKSPSKYETN